MIGPPPQTHAEFPDRPDFLDNDVEIERRMTEINEHDLFKVNASPKSNPLRHNFNFSNCQITFYLPGPQ